MSKALIEWLMEFIAITIPIFQKLLYKISPKVKIEPQELNDWNTEKHSFILIYVGYSPDIDKFSADYLNSFRSKGAFIVFVTNYPNFNYHNIDPSLMDVFIDNKNQGWDFAQYRSASLYVKDKFGTNIPEKIIYANDSVFFLDRGNSEHVDRLLDQEYDFIGAFELSGLGRHAPWQLSSWLFSTSKTLFLSNKFQDFWSKHVPIKNKRHAIRNGEHKLTATALSFSGRVKAIYSNDYLLSILHRYIEQHGGPETFKLVASALINDYEKRFESACQEKDFPIFVARNLFAHSPLHMFVLLLLQATDFPFVKKDLFWFNNLTYDKLDKLESIICNAAGHENAGEIMRYFLRRGRFSEAPLKTRLMIRLGMR